MNTNEMTFKMTHHCMKQALAKGIDPLDILEAASYPTVVYESRRYPGQMRHVRGDLCVIIAEDGVTIVTVYLNVVETDLRPDQTDRDALRYGKGRR